MAIIWFEDLNCLNPVCVGSKGANLAKLLKHGYRVPKGFCLSSDSVAQICNDKNLIGNLESALAILPKPWCVRSSSTAEDSVSKSFAGIFTSFLGLSSSNEIKEAILEVSESLNNPEVETYLKAHLIDEKTINMAVIVQKLVLSACSGVAFTRDPISGTNEICIECTWGIGDTLMNGEVTPDSYKVSRDGKITFSQNGCKEVQSVFRAGKLVREAIAEGKQTLPALKVNEILLLAKLACEIEKDFGCPQDIEWAMCDGNFFILQARPITSLNR